MPVLRASVSGGAQAVESDRWSLAAVATKSPNDYLPRERYFLDLFGASGSLDGVTDIDLEISVGASPVVEVEGVVVEAVWNHTDLSVAFDGAPIDLLAVQFLKLFARQGAVPEWRALVDESAREAWLTACLWFAAWRTPWTNIVPEFTGRAGPFPRRDIPEEIVISIGASEFASPAGLFCYLGEAFLGPCGYMGQDLHGMAELVRALKAAGVRMKVTIPNARNAREVAAASLGGAAFIDDLASTMRAGGVEVVLVDVQPPPHATSQGVLMIAPPWQVDLRGLVVGETLDEHTRRRLQLGLEEADTPEGCDCWTDPKGDLRVVTTDGRVSLVNIRDAIVVNGYELVGADRPAVTRVLGAADSVDEIAESMSYRLGAWELCVGFDEDHVTWVALSNDEVM